MVAFALLRGAEMLNIRINLTINLKKVGATLLAGFIFFAHLVTPASAVTAKALPGTEKSVTVSLTYLTVTTTKTQAINAISSPYAKYFDAEALAFLSTYANGYPLAEWKCLDKLWTHESHFNPKALNMGSHAFGIAQFLPNTWGNYKVVKTSSAALQIQYGLRYIHNRYGSTCGAWSFWQKHGWY
jgi:hypothetical protein